MTRVLMKNAEGSVVQSRSYSSAQEASRQAERAVRRIAEWNRGAFPVGDWTVEVR